jgi:glycosyltransferase involved in cell wall biosynthesis|tara:strand:- start:1984 stop:3021 length:1038 start_codon:yes stop_codon:yes gene_type:complete
MKVALSIHHHSPSYGGPYTVISETAYYMYKKNLNINLLMAENQYTTFKRNYNAILKSIDLLHCFGIWTPDHIKVFYSAKKLKKKIIISPLGALEPWSMLQKKYKKKLAWFIYQKKILEDCDHIHATSDDEKKHLIDLNVTTPITVIPHGVAINNVKKDKIIKNKKKALFFSRIHEKKGLLELVESWSLVNNPNWILEIYGPVSDTAYFNKVKQKISKLNLAENIKIFKPQFDKKKKEEIILSSDCFILPSKSENFGMSIVEALSYGIPVLTTTATPWEILKKKNAGIIFNFSKNNLTNSLWRMTNMSSEQLFEMGNNGREYLIKNFEINKIIEDYINFYKEVLNN